MFLQYYEKRLKLQLLRSELEAISNAAASIIVPQQELGGRDPTGDFSLTVLESVLADTYTVLAQQTALLTILNGVRWQCRQVNQDMQRWAPHAYNQAASTGAVLQERGNRMNRYCIQIRNTCTAAIQMLDEFLSKA